MVKIKPVEGYHFVVAIDITFDITIVLVLNVPRSAVCDSSRNDI